MLSYLIIFHLKVTSFIFMAFLKVFIVAAHYKLDSHFLSRTTWPVQQLVRSYSILNISKNCLEVITFNLQFEIYSYWRSFFLSYYNFKVSQFTKILVLTYNILVGHLPPNNPILQQNMLIQHKFWWILTIFGINIKYLKSTKYLWEKRLRD